jgi:hypothetical protein
MFSSSVSLRVRMLAAAGAVLALLAGGMAAAETAADAGHGIRYSAGHGI